MIALVPTRAFEVEREPTAARAASFRMRPDADGVTG